MKTLPSAARIYLVAIWLSGLIALLAAIESMTNFFLPWSPIWVIALVAADYFEISFDVSGSRVVTTLAEATLIFLVIVSGTTSVVVAAIGTTIVELLRRRPWYRAIFNIAIRCIAIFLMVLVFRFINKTEFVTFTNYVEIASFFIIALVHYISITFSVAFMIALATKKSIGGVYRDSFALIQWIHLLTLPIGALMAAHWNTNRWLIIFDIIILLIAQRSFILVAQLQAESQRNKALADERERLLEDLKDRQERLIRASKLSSLGTFSAGIAHEFNNLLQVIDGNAALGVLADDKAEMRHCLALIEKTSKRGSSITRSLLTFGKKSDLRRMMIQLGDVVADVLEIIVPELRKVHVDVRCEIAPVPATYADPGQLMQVLLNLLGNARDAMMPNGGTITLHVHADEADIIMSITDTGIGMSIELQRDLFQPFVTTKGQQGTGLGLAICYGIVEQHEGSIDVISEIGVGTTMTVRLPIVLRDEPAIRLSLDDMLRLETATSQELVRIL